MPIPIIRVRGIFAINMGQQNMFSKTPWICNIEILIPINRHTYFKLAQRAFHRWSWWVMSRLERRTSCRATWRIAHWRFASERIGCGWGMGQECPKKMMIFWLHIFKDIMYTTYEQFGGMGTLEVYIPLTLEFLRTNHFVFLASPPIWGQANMSTGSPTHWWLILAFQKCASVQVPSVCHSVCLLKHVPTASCLAYPLILYSLIQKRWFP